MAASIQWTHRKNTLSFFAKGRVQTCEMDEALSLVNALLKRERRRDVSQASRQKAAAADAGQTYASHEEGRRGLQDEFVDQMSDAFSTGGEDDCQRVE